MRLSKYRILLACSLALITVPSISVVASPLWAVEQNVAASVKATVITRRFSIDYPDHWIVTSNRNDSVIIYNQPPSRIGGDVAPPYMIKTDISVQPGSLREALRPYENEPGRVRRIEEVTINGRPGIRIWEESEGWAFRNAIATYIPISRSEVAHITSFYSRENRAAEQAIVQMQNTFKLF
jgi:hypothetical protein